MTIKKIFNEPGLQHLKTNKQNANGEFFPTKKSKLDLRLTSEEKRKLKYLVECEGCSSMSEWIRNQINFEFKAQKTLENREVLKGLRK